MASDQSPLLTGIVEAMWKYNHRKEARPWDAFMEAVFA